MAELLILNFDTSNPDAEANRHAWKRGHVIDIKPDGHAWGSQECLPKFAIIKIPDATVAEVEHFFEDRKSVV